MAQLGRWSGNQEAEKNEDDAKKERLRRYEAHERAEKACTVWHPAYTITVRWGGGVQRGRDSECESPRPKQRKNQ